MPEYRFFPEPLVNEILRYQSIPRPINKDEKLKRYHKYYIDEFRSVVKVMEILEINGQEYYDVMTQPGKMSSCISYPIEYNEVYEMVPDKLGIKDKYIIGHKNSFYGSEIRYWFLVNRENFLPEHYRMYMNGFGEFLDSYSNYAISNSKKYFVVHNPEKEDKEFRIILDTKQRG